MRGTLTDTGGNRAPPAAKGPAPSSSPARIAVPGFWACIWMTWGKKYGAYNSMSLILMM